MIYYTYKAQLMRTVDACRLSTTMKCTAKAKVMKLSLHIYSVLSLPHTHHQHL